MIVPRTVLVAVIYLKENGFSMCQAVQPTKLPITLTDTSCHCGVSNVNINIPVSLPALESFPVVPKITEAISATLSVSKA